MGFSTSAVVVILAASLLYMATMYYPLVERSYNRVLDAEKNLNEFRYEKLNTKIVITNAEITGGNLAVTVNNNGSTTLNSSKLNVIHNGTFITSSSFDVSKKGVWTPKNSINVTINGVTAGRVKIITANGAADYAVR